MPTSKYDSNNCAYICIIIGERFGQNVWYLCATGNIRQVSCGFYRRGEVVKSIVTKTLRKSAGSDAC